MYYFCFIARKVASQSIHPGIFVMGKTSLFMTFGVIGTALTDLSVACPTALFQLKAHSCFGGVIYLGNYSNGVFVEN